ncbi:BMP family ABC transporter substrate-binding protein [Virgibacillus profundi]|uniref:BMP family ABC transporter substrate-binding protein n=1 Tax=Virgibacillus profundi TaxID=2024555 RepID=A0A2A2IEA5_9BACI|nr:BMP family protein [Virgibacillus profundi]PAV30059.1 BMP family ABC transporter substrate-binding protein [Virgibacillus profundi]PXY54232.1 BMP family ABC transporter substrate-binding protein [Virgibacillus profundi]
MKNRKFILLFALLLSLGIILAACGSGGSDEESGDTDSGSDNETSDEEASTDFSAAMVTDIGGVDDKSFNQSSWEGLKAWGEEHGLSKGNGINYAQSDEKADYIPNLNRLIRDEYDLIFGIGFELKEDLQKVADQYPDTKFALVDDTIEADNGVSITFKEHQGSFLVGVAAAKKTNTNKLGFVGGIDSPLINKFESGFIAGAKSVNPDIEVEVDYAESFGDAAKGKIIASTMYNNDIDIIFHAAGGTGNGVFNEAKDLKQNDPEREIWVIGVDRDQHEEGQIGDHNVTLTSMIKRVDVAVQDVANQAMNGDFPGGGLLEYGLEEDAISFATTNEEAMTEDIISEVEEWQEKIASGELEVPQTREETEAFVDGL